MTTTFPHRFLGLRDSGSGLICDNFGSAPVNVNARIYKMQISPVSAISQIFKRD